MAAATLAGADLAAAGVLIQIVLANSLASPGIIGVNSGAGLAAALCMALLPELVIILPLVAFSGTLVTALAVYSIARRAGAPAGRGHYSVGSSSGIHLCRRVRCTESEGQAMK